MPAGSGSYNGLAVQQVLEEALARATGESRSTITGASRTDAGVHALGQAFHFDTDKPPFPRRSIPLCSTPCFLRDIRVHQGLAGARRTSTHGFITLRQALYLPHLQQPPRHRAAAQPVPPMCPCRWTRTAHATARPKRCWGRHDFAAFQASGGTAKTTVRTLTLAQVTRAGRRP